MYNSGGTSYFTLSTDQHLLYGRLKAEHWYCRLGEQQPGQVPSPASIPHWPVLPFQPRNKSPPNTALRGGREGCPCSPTFPAGAEMCRGFNREHSQNSIIKECFGDAGLPAGHCSFSPGPWQPAQQLAQPLSHFPTPGTESQPGISPQAPTGFHSRIRHETLLGLSQAAKQTLALQNPVQAWPGRCHFWVQRRAQLPDCPVQRTQCTHADALQVCLSSDHFCTTSDDLISSRLILPLKTQPGWYILRDWYQIALSSFSPGITLGDKLFTLSVTAHCCS